MRNKWMDITKGIGILLVIAGHTSIPPVASNFIYAFHMPLFFMASGWMTNWDKYDVISFIRRKTKTLLIPFIIYSTLVISLMELIGEKHISTFLAEGWGGYALWFVPILLIALLLAKIIYSTIGGGKLLIGATALLMISGAALKFFNLYLPWSLCSVPYATALILLGSLLRRFEKYINSPRWYIILLGLVLVLVISHFYRLDICWNDIIPVFSLTLGAVAGTAMTATISSFLANHTKYTSRILQEIGKETFLIIALFQVTHMVIEYYLVVGTLIRYLISICLLIVFKFFKDWFNKRLNFKLL